MDHAVVAETRRETLRRYAIVLRLQDRGSPTCAAPLRFAVPASLAYRPEPSVARAFAGTTVHWTIVFFRLTLLRLEDR
ncbi:MAG: hypothetical protein V3S77_04920, partial [Acidiferrobacterales bacterium]